MLPLIGMLAPLVVLPLVSRVGGPQVWQGLGVGQAVGAVASVVVMWGWWALGPVLYSRANDESSRHALYVESLQQRTLIFLVVAPIAAILSAAISPSGSEMFAALISIGSAGVGLAPNWYAIGAGKPRLLATFASAPNAIAVIVSAVVIAIWQQIWIYPALLLISTIVPPFILARWLTRRPLAYLVTPTSLIRGLRRQAPVAATNLLGQSYAGAPVPVVSAFFSISQASQFVSADRLYRMSGYAINALSSSLHGWVLENGSPHPRRQRAALGLHVMLGIAGGTCIALVGPLFTAVLFGSDVGADFLTCLFYGLSFVFLSVTTALSKNLLIPAGRVRVTFTAGLAAAVTGFPFMILSSLLFSSSWVVAAVLAGSEMIITAILVIPAARVMIALSQKDPDEPIE